MKIAKGASAKDAPKKTPTVGDKYDTLAGNDGVWFWSDFIPVEKGKAYWLTIDAKGPADAGLAVRLSREDGAPISAPTRAPFRNTSRRSSAASRRT